MSRGFYRFHFVELAQEISGRMPACVARRIQDALYRLGKPLNGSHVVLLGVTYKANVSDKRETPARPLAAHLFGLGAEVSFVDPHVESLVVRGRDVPRIEDLNEAVGLVDIVVLLQPHDEFLAPDVLSAVD